VSLLCVIRAAAAVWMLGVCLSSKLCKQLNREHPVCLTCYGHPPTRCRPSAFQAKHLSHAVLPAALHCIACRYGANTLRVVLAVATSHQQHAAGPCTLQANCSSHVVLVAVYCLLHCIVLVAGVVLTPCVLHWLSPPAISSMPQAQHTSSQPLVATRAPCCTAFYCLQVWS
jgi:hypothetical protein